MRMTDQICLRYNGVSLILELRCPLAQPHSWRTEPTSAKVRKYQLMHSYFTSRHCYMHYCEVLFPRWNTRCEWLYFAGLSTEMVTLRLLAVEISPSSAIYRNSMLLHNSSSYNHEWWPVLEYLDCTVEGFLIADWAIKRNVLVDSITWEANWELSDFPLRLQSMYSFKCLSILTVTKIGDCDLWRRARLQIKKNSVVSTGCRRHAS